MAIPSWNKSSVVSLHGHKTNNKIFENFIESMPHMNMTVSIRRTIMKNKLRFPFMFFTNQSVEIILFPLSKNLWFPLDQIGFHRKICLWQIERFFIVHSHKG